jgi:CRP-like cAMP-binding protein
MTIADADRLKREILLRSMFPSMPAAAHARFIELLEDVEVEAGQTLFDIGDPSDRLLFLIEGRVVLQREGFRSWEFVPIAVVGVIDVVLGRARTRSCRALERSRMLSIRASDWFDMLEDNGQIARAAIRNFATQLHISWRTLAPRVRRSSEPPPGPVPPALETYDKILALRRAPFLRLAGMQAIASLAKVAEAVQLEQGQLLFDVGTQEEQWYVVARGAVELRAGDEFRLHHAGGDLVGGAAALSRALGGYSARAESDAVVLSISEQDFYDQAEEHPGLARGTLEYLVSELEPILDLEDPTERRPAAGPITQGA